MKRAVIYARVSTDRQAEHGYSLPTQLEGCRRYAAENGFIVSRELADDISGEVPIIDRPSGKHLYELVDAGEVDAVILYTHDRTARDENVLEYLLFKSYLHERGVELHYSDSGHDRYTMEGNLVGYIKAHAAASERKKIAERTKRGKEAKARAGAAWNGGNPPFGYSIVGEGRKAHLVVDEQEAQIVRKIFNLYIRGYNRNEPLSLQAVANELNRVGIPIGKRFTRTNSWMYTTVGYILSNSIYAGIRFYGKTRKINGKVVKQPEEKWIRVEVPELTIIEPEIFHRAQERKKKNKLRARRNGKRRYLMRGHLFCWHCGNAMGGCSVNKIRKDGKKRRVYRCTRFRYRYQEDKYCIISNSAVGAEIVESLSWDWLRGLLGDDERVRRGLRQMRELAETGMAPKRERLARVQSLIMKVDRKIERLMSEWGDEEDTTITGALKVEAKRAAKHKRDLENEQERLQVELSTRKISPEIEENILALARDIRSKLEDASFEQKRMLFDMLNLRVEFRRDDDLRWLDMSCELGNKSIDINSP
jgi:site-specific DNA recombinase